MVKIMSVRLMMPCPNARACAGDAARLGFGVVVAEEWLVISIMMDLLSIAVTFECAYYTSISTPVNDSQMRRSLTSV
jgi:hypothetical protein